MIERIAWQNANCGSFIGAMRYDVMVGPEGIDIIEALTTIKTHDKSKIVHFHGNFTLENSDDMYTMTKSLRDMGYAVVVTSDGRHFFPWFTWVNFLIVETSKVWPGFDVAEFRWQNIAAEPCLPSNAEKCNLFIDGKPEDILGFIKTHPRTNPWRMLLRTKTLEEKLYGGN